MKQDYSLLGQSGKEAVASGLANPHWFRPKVDPKEIRELSLKNDLRPTIDALIWLGLLVISGSLAVYTFPSWWGVPFWLITVSFILLHPTLAGMSVVILRPLKLHGRTS